MNQPQPGILLPVPPHARYLSCTLHPGADPRASLHTLCDSVDGEEVVVGLGAPLVAALGRNLSGLRAFPAATAGAVPVPSTQAALWLWLRGSDRGELVHASRHLRRRLDAAFTVDSCIDAFLHHAGRDLTGYEDGTENPQGDAALAAALSVQPGLAGSSYVAVQQWVHDFARFEAMAPAAQDRAIGRRRSDNAELDDAPDSAHVKRTAQESFAPEAFVLRRSMPWADATAAGLVFTAFGASFDAFEAQLRRMCGQDDGITDALFGFTRPLTGAYYWCPALQDGRLDLAPLGL